MQRCDRWRCNRADLTCDTHRTFQRSSNEDVCLSRKGSSRSRLDLTSKAQYLLHEMVLQACLRIKALCMACCK